MNNADLVTNLFIKTKHNIAIVSVNIVVICVGIEDSSDPSSTLTYNKYVI